MIPHSPLPRRPVAAAAGLLGAAAGILLTRHVLHRQLAAARALAAQDPLTGLPNRRALIAEVNARLTGRRPTALVLIDLDDFKTVNDTWGHPTGDDLLIVVAHRLRALTPPGGYAARLAGDEFVVLQPHRRDADVTATVATLLTRLAEPVQIGAATLRPHASAGVATSGHTRSSWNELISRADHALYQAKASDTRVAVDHNDRPPPPRHRDRH